MKRIVFLGLMALGMASLNAQAPIKSGETQLNAGLGLSYYGNPVYVGLEFGLPDNFSAGVDFSYRSWENRYNKHSDFYYKYSVMGLGGFANYHFNKVFKMPSKWDLYAGLSLNYFIWTDRSDYTYYKYPSYSHGSPISLGGQIGARYFFNKSFGLNLEGNIGSSISGGKFGITYKF